LRAVKANRVRIDVFSLFPDSVDAPLSASIVGRARTTGALDLHSHDIRSWTHDVHRTADDTPFGGGAGMVMKVEPSGTGVEAIQAAHGQADRIFVLAASGTRFDQVVAHELAVLRHIILICGHYEGIDARVPELLGAEELSIGDYVLTGGELAAAVVIDSITRLLPGVIKSESITEESHTAGLLEYPHYTRPATFRGLGIPAVLLSGHHAEIARWRRRQALKRTAERRPDLLQGAELTEEEQRWLAGLEVRDPRHENP
jgi:tRNA (guanine37-N1)-methyltransferase